MKDSITLNIQGIRLTRRDHSSPTSPIVSKFACVDIQVHGVWVELIRESLDGPFSHIIEPSGIQQIINDHCDQQSYADLAASGGILIGVTAGD
jgi:hypothetical protein